jgi:dephospho-CoA kinase
MSSEGSLLVGLTGGIGTGKSRVADLLEELGASVVCSDRVVHELQAAGGPALAAIVAEFGEDFLTSEGELDRVRLGRLVFETPDARRKLGRIMGPLILPELRRRTEELQSRGDRVVVVDIPLLIESRGSGRGAGALLPFDLVLLVYASEAQQLERVIARDELSEGEARSRIAAQLSIEEKRGLADVVVDNSGSWEETEKFVRELYAGWLGGTSADSKLPESGVPLNGA